MSTISAIVRPAAKECRRILARTEAAVDGRRGRTIDLTPGRRIVQAWRAGNWPDGAYSIARFELEPHGSDTKLILEHAAFPEENAPHVESGWHKMYWEPLKKYLRK